MAIEEFAPAKVNLTLHVTGRRADGYHLLDSLVVFAEVGDVVRAAPSARLSLSLSGPFGTELEAGRDNLVLRAAGLIDPAGTAQLSLEKNLPVASGLGGGSADAAAALRALARLWGADLPAPERAARLGADVPVCLEGAPCRMRGTGERLDRLPPLPPVTLVLVNPRLPLATAAVFAALAGRANPPMPEPLPDLAGFDALLTFLAACRNDLEPAARRLMPAIAEVTAALAAQPGCRLARMSGSGATCFGLFAGRAAAEAAAAAIRRDRPAWWVAAAAVLPPPS